MDKMVGYLCRVTRFCVDDEETVEFEVTVKNVAGGTVSCDGVGSVESYDYLESD